LEGRFSSLELTPQDLCEAWFAVRETLDLKVEEIFPSMPSYTQHMPQPCAYPEARIEVLDWLRGSVSLDIPRVLSVSEQDAPR
jgi:hypothetical protein